jgi:hypothetical protein
LTYPAKPIITYSYTGFQTAQGGNSFPGTQMDAPGSGGGGGIANSGTSATGGADAAGAVIIEY